jgi:hypothetical protein
MHRTGMTMCVAAVIASLGASSSAAAQSALLDRLQIHGYLSQGYATSSELPLFGIPTDGSTDYRNAALQFRYALSDADFAVIQLKHRRLGGSVLTADGNDVELGWAFYQRRFGAASVRVGRVPLPLGIFNETRDVGTLLPFYRAPGNFYMEGIETIDGVIAAYELQLGHWSVETQLGYGGVGLKFPYATPVGPQLVVKRFEDLKSGQLWVNSPIPGLRFGASGFLWESMDDNVGSVVDMNVRQVFVDAAFEPAYVRGEYREIDLGSLRINNYYAQGGLRFGAFSLNGQADFSDWQVATPIGAMRYQAARDLAVGVNYAHRSNLIYKLEAHRSRGSNFDVYLDPMAGQGRTSYFIGSVSVSF